MTRPLLSIFVCLIAFLMTPPAISDYSTPSDDVPGRDTPGELVSVWLLFHEAELCLGVHATFSFANGGMQVHGTIEDEKSARKFEEMIAPYRNSYRIEITLNKPAESHKSADEDDAGSDDRNPPPSLWENYELRSFLGDPLARAKEREGFNEDSQLYFFPTGELLKQRLLIYAQQTLAFNRKMERYAKDLPALTRVALDPERAPVVRAQAYAVCLAHAEGLERFAGKLESNLEEAFPSPRKKEQVIQPEKSGVTLKTPVDRADYLSEFAQETAKRVYQFIYPEHYAIGLDELRRPSQLDSLKTLQIVVLEFEKELKKAR
jgi:hypothetical protein